ncbi:MAG: sulfite exporter TauE/SafE family protein [Anaeromyxobacter sp.]
MTPAAFTLAVLVVSFLAGLLGSLVGLGGGIIVVPALSLVLGVDMRHAIGASIVAVIATSTGSAARYVREHLSNLRVAMVLELATAAGALVGALMAGQIPTRGLKLLFGALQVFTVVTMLRHGRGGARLEPPPDAWADRLQLHGAWTDPVTGREHPYRVARTRFGLAVSGAAGVVSGLLGVGGGLFKVPAMTLAMGIPLKVATATSNFMIGVTAAAGAAVYFARGDVLPFVAAPVAVGVVLGATTGARIMGRVPTAAIRWLFVGVASITAVQMLIQGVR